MSDGMKQYYEEYGRKVFLYLMTLCSDPDTAEELTQETFYQAIKNVGKYKGESSVYTWLCGRPVPMKKPRRTTRKCGLCADCMNSPKPKRRYCSSVRQEN